MIMDSKAFPETLSSAHEHFTPNLVYPKLCWAYHNHTGLCACSQHLNTLDTSVRGL